MNIETLKYFHDVVMLKSISKVAAASHISQSALSQKLNKLEESLGIIALIRSNKGVELTPEGKVLYSYSKRILDEYSNLYNDLNKLNSQQCSLTLQTSGLASSYILPIILDKVSSRYKDFTYNAIYKYPTNVEADIVNRLCDVVISTTSLTDMKFKSIYLGSDELICISRSHSFSDFKAIPFLLLEDEHNIEDKIYNIIPRDNIKIRTNSLHTIITLLTTTNSIAILPKLCVADELKNGLFKEIILPLEDNTYDLYLTYEPDILTFHKDTILFISKVLKKLMKSS